MSLNGRTPRFRRLVAVAASFSRQAGILSAYRAHSAPFVSSTRCQLRQSAAAPLAPGTDFAELCVICDPNQAIRRVPRLGRLIHRALLADNPGPAIYRLVRSFRCAPVSSAPQVASWGPNSAVRHRRRVSSALEFRPRVRARESHARVDPLIAARAFPMTRGCGLRRPVRAGLASQAHNRFP